MAQTTGLFEMISVASIVPEIPQQASYAIQFAMVLVILAAVGWLLKLVMSLLDKQREFGASQTEKFSTALKDHDQRTQELMTGVTKNLNEFGDRVVERLGTFETASVRQSVLAESVIRLLASKDDSKIDVDRLVESVIRQTTSRG